MSPETWLVDRLKSDPGVTAIAAGRVYAPRVAQREQMPFVTYQRTKTYREDTLDHPDELPKATFAVMCWTDSADPVQGYGQSVALANAVRLAVQGRRIESTDHQLDYTKVVDEFDAPVYPQDGDDALYHCRQLTIEVHYAETVKPFGP